MSRQKTLIVITGATASGKTSLAIDVARHLGCGIISADSRQLFREIPIGTAAPSAEEQAAVPHYFVGTLGLDDYYSAAMFEADVMALLPSLWAENDYVVMAGGSMMYVDAVINGIDDIPTVSEENRRRAMQIYESKGLQGLRLELLELDPVYYREVDLNNHRRLVHAIEIIYQSGRRYSDLRSGTKKSRPFRILKFAIDIPRDELFERINRRVDTMVEQGLEQEVASVAAKRHLNSLNTVGYKEIFAMMDGVMTREEALLRIGKNTRVYAKKQLTWLRRDPSVIWIPSGQAGLKKIMQTLTE
ncbi:MAG: tRNA (adenosine(37)-N6)-dimethylallyltransferase MiaA [Muribaculaceae bacterium]|nr:tRNA (adenosine(37)-N6)-dimethylallyltransferase MiaA [Muribaculaceae bacterium]